MPRDQIHHRREEKHRCEQHGVNRLAFGNQVHEEAGDQGGFDRGDEQRNRDRRGNTRDVDVIHEHRQDRPGQQREENHQILLNVLAHVVCVMAMRSGGRRAVGRCSGRCLSR